VEARAWRRLCGGGEISERTGADRPEAGSPAGPESDSKWYRILF
jgi:hypothetical protein